VTDLKIIAERINKIIESDRNKDFNNQAVNWGDLGVVEITLNREVYPEQGKVYYHVLIEEASPDSYEFIGYIVDTYYELYGYVEDIQIITEW